MTARIAKMEDADAIKVIYNQGIAERTATFETRPRTEEDIKLWFDGSHPVVVAERDGVVAGFAAAFPYRTRECYSGIAEFSVYVERSHRGLGVGKTAIEKLISTAAEAGFWKLLSRVFPENLASRKVLSAAGFREVGIYENHAKLDGKWRDVVIVEYLIRSNIR
jgi:L-amino acid N-acyltransferase YncA